MDVLAEQVTEILFHLMHVEKRVSERTVESDHHPYLTLGSEMNRPRQA